MALNVKLETANLGLNGATPVAKDSAYTQTYATAARTVANNTASTPTITAVAATPVATADPNYGFASSALFDAMVTRVNALVTDVAAILTQITNIRADLDNIKKPVNSLIDYLQSRGDIG